MLQKKHKMTSVQTSSPELLVTFGKKPRKSKTSLRYEYMGQKFYLYSNKANTLLNIWLFHDVEPYPLIAVFAMSQDEDHSTVQDWIKSHLIDIKIKLGDYRDKIQLPLDSWTMIQKNQKQLSASYEIYDGNELMPESKLIVVPRGKDFLYLRVRGNYPKKPTASNRDRPDKDLVLKEYLRRKENEKILHSKAVTSDGRSLY